MDQRQVGRGVKEDICPCSIQLTKLDWSWCVSVPCRPLASVGLKTLTRGPPHGAILNFSSCLLACLLWSLWRSTSGKMRSRQPRDPPVRRSERHTALHHIYIITFLLFLSPLGYSTSARFILLQPAPSFKSMQPTPSLPAVLSE